MAAVIRSSGPEFALEPWNPWLAVIPFAAFLLLIWSAVEGDLWALPLATIVGSHCIQCHIGYAMVIVGPLLVTVVWLVVQHRAECKDWLRSPLVRWSGVAVVVGGLVWLPTLLDQLTREPGNLAILVEHFATPTEAFLGGREVASVVMDQLNLAGPWLVGAGPIAAPFPGFALLISGWLLAVVVSRRRADASMLRLHKLLAITALFGIVSVTRIFGGYFEYTVRWWWIITALVVAASGQTLLRQRASGSAVAAGCALVGMVTITVACVQFATRAEFSTDSRTIGGLAVQLDPQLSRDARYLLRWHDPTALGDGAFGLVLEMERRGYHLGVDQWSRAAAEPFRIQPEETAATVLWYITGEISIAEFGSRPGAVQLAYVDPRSPDERVRSVEVRTTIERRFRELGRDDLIRLLDAQYATAQLRLLADLPDDVLSLIVEYDDLRMPAAVFEVPVFWGLFEA